MILNDLNTVKKGFSVCLIFFVCLFVYNIFLSSLLSTPSSSCERSSSSCFILITEQAFIYCTFLHFLCLLMALSSISCNGLILFLRFHLFLIYFKKSPC